MGLPVLALSEPSSCDDLRLAREITLLSTQMNVANHRLLKLIAEFDVRGGWRSGDVMRSCAHWLAANCGMAIGAARDKVRVARRLAGLPEMEKAFSTGELSYSKVRAITRVATESNESFLVTMAEQVSASHLEKLVGKYKPVDEIGLDDLMEAEAGAEGFLLRNGHIDANGSSSVDGCGDGDSGSQGRAGVPGDDSRHGDTNIAGAKACDGHADEIDEESRRENARELFWFQDKDGMWVIHAKLPPEQGQLVIKMLEAVTRPIQEERQEAWKEEQKRRLQAVARNIMRRHRETGKAADTTENCDLEGTVVGARGTEGGAEGGSRNSESESVSGMRDETEARQKCVPGAVIPVSVAVERAQEKNSAESFSQFMNQVRADAFSNVAEHFLATCGDFSELQNLKGAERCQVVLHIDINTLRGRGANACCTHSKAHFEDKPWLCAQTARRLSCDASLVTVLEDEQGEVLNVGRRTRIVPPHIRRALLERDGVCQHPGCHESKYVDAHHIKHWADGGETSLSNLVTLCRFHHRELHRGNI